VKFASMESFVFHADVHHGLSSLLYCKEISSKVLVVKVGLGVCCW
jgi:hypothetical protein